MISAYVHQHGIDMSKVGEMNATHSFPVKGYNNSGTTITDEKHLKAENETFN